MQIFKAILLSCFLLQVCCEQGDDIADGHTVGSTDTVGISESSTSTGDETSTKSTIDTDGDSVLTTIFPNLTDIATNFTNETDEDTTTTSEQWTPTTEVILPEINRTSCSENTCKNGGTCLEGIESFSCDCKPGYTGALCGTVDNCMKNDDGETCFKGTCVYAEDGSSRFCKCYPRQYWDSAQKICRNPDPPCFPNPCDNEGLCEENKREFKCQCQAGYEGPTCSVQNKCGEDGECPKGKCVTDEEAGLKYCKCRGDSYWNKEHEKCEEKSSCIPNPCKHFGVCESLQNGDRNCTCAEGYSGDTCEIRDYCTTDDNCNGGQCVLSKSKDSRLCRCKEGFHLDETVQSCKENVKPCLPNPCANDGICIPIDSTNFNCTCSEGYVGERCTESDLCILDGGNTYCGEASCLTHSKLGVFYCSCAEDQFFDYSERKCKDVDLCPLVYCDFNEYCEKGNCHCKQNFRWNNDTGKCESSFCASDPCPAEHMECKEDTENEGYQCFCKEGYAYDGNTCKKASCIFPHLNFCTQKCDPSEDGYLCDCHEQFELKEDNTTCSFVGNTTCTNKTCENGACMKTEEDETCICPPGYSEVNGKCVDDCTAEKLPLGFCPGDLCEAVSGMGFRCKCEGKYVLSADKVTCIRRKMCREYEIGWTTCSSLNATCKEDWSSPEGFRCDCAADQIQTVEGICRDLCSTEKNQRACAGMGAVCDVDHDGLRICRCPPFFQVNERSDFCNKPAEFSFLVTMPLDVDTYQNYHNRMKRSLTSSDVNYHKVQLDVHATMRRLFAEFERVNVLNCEPRKEYLLCKMELQFQQVSRQDLNKIKMQDLCISNDDTDASCLLPPSLVLRKDKIQTEIFIETTDPCDEDVKENLCGSETACSSTLDKKTFNCTCKAGFVARNRIFPLKGSHSFIEVCKDIDECEESNPCPENSKCTNTIGSYQCSCLPGYRVASESTESNELNCFQQCNPNPCTHGQCTERGDHEFDCSCDAGFAGATCNLQDENFKKAHVDTIIVGAVLGGILLLTIILFIASVTRLRKKKFLDDPSQMLYNAAEMTERRPADSGAINNAFQRD